MKKQLPHFHFALLRLSILSFSLNRLAIRLKRYLTKRKIAAFKCAIYFFIVPLTTRTAKRHAEKQENLKIFN
jgi:hypothetical protein